MGPSRTRRASGLKPQIGQPRRARIRVLLVDDHPVVRWGLTCCLATSRDITVIGEAADGREALRKIEALSPDVVVMDIDMPQLNGLSATEIIRRKKPEVIVLLLSMHPYTNHMARIVHSGARGFLLKDARPEEIVAAIRKVVAGETCFSPDLAREAIRHFNYNPAVESAGKALSYREREVLIGIAEGLSNKQLAARLGISARTVETHRGHIMYKLNIRSVAGLTRFAVSRGLVILEEKASG